VIPIDGFPGAIVAHAWFHTENAEEIIALQAAFPLVRGIRSKPVTGESPARMTPGAPGTMHDERWLRGFWLLERYGLSWDFIGYPASLESGPLDGANGRRCLVGRRR
jgi:hypothetical protein